MGFTVLFFTNVIFDAYVNVAPGPIRRLYLAMMVNSL